jgi:hypothetical protein
MTLNLMTKQPKIQREVTDHIYASDKVNSARLGSSHIIPISHTPLSAELTARSVSLLGVRLSSVHTC